MAEYLHTTVGECPSCSGIYPGHVYGDERAHTWSWTCPDCEQSFYVDRVDIVYDEVYKNVEETLKR